MVRSSARHLAWLPLLLVAGSSFAGEGEVGDSANPDPGNKGGDPRTPERLLEMAETRQRLASPEEARDLYEQMLAGFPSHPLAATALARAFELNLVLGELDHALEQGRLFAKRFGASKPAAAAGIAYRMGQIFAERGQTEEWEAHLRDYLAAWSKRGGVARAAVAHFKLGEILWNRSCPREPVQSACVELAQPLKAPSRVQKMFESPPYGLRYVKHRMREHCVSWGILLLKAIERDPRLAREAQAHFRAALRLSAGPDQDGLSSPELRADLAFSRAGSAFYQAEPIFERILDIRFPPDMDFQPVGRFDGAKVAVARAKKLKASLRKFGAYLHGKNRLIEQMAGPAPTGLYQQVMGYGVPHWNLAALARMAQAQMELAQQLFMAPIPQDLKERDEWGNRPREIFCDKVIDTGEPAEAKAMSGYELCLETARKQSWWNEWSALCEEGLNRMNPARYPLSREMEPEADLAPPPSAPPAVQPDCATCQF